jgi:hypothetical protein
MEREVFYLSNIQVTCRTFCCLVCIARQKEPRFFNAKQHSDVITSHGLDTLLLIIYATVGSPIISTLCCVL